MSRFFQHPRSSIPNEEGSCRFSSRFSSRYSSFAILPFSSIEIEDDRKHRSSISTRVKIGDGSPFGAHVERTCVLRAWVVAYYWVSRSRKANLDSPPPARHLSALPTLLGRSRASPPSLLKTSLRLALPLLPPSFTFTSFPPFFSSAPFFFTHPRIWPQTIARSRTFLRRREEGGGVTMPASDWRGTREQGCLEDTLFFYPNRILFVARDTKREGKMKEFFFSSGMRLLLWWRRFCFFFRYFLWRNFVFGINDGFWDGVFSFFSTCE